MLSTVASVLTEQGSQAFFFGLKQLTRSSEVCSVKDIPYGELQRQSLDIYRPRQQLARYTVVFIHGGSWRFGNKDQYAYVGQALAKRGINCVVLNYRLFPAAVYPQFVNDVAQALVWLQASGRYYGINNVPLFLMGHSAGAHLAMLAAMDERIAIKTGFDRAQVKGIFSLAGVYSFRPENSALYQRIFPLEASGENYLNTKPINFVKEVGVPIYMLHGRQDKTVACRSAERMYKNALLAKHPIYLEIRENYGHVEPLFEFVSLAPNHSQLMGTLEQFMQDHSE